MSQIEITKGKLLKDSVEIEWTERNSLDEKPDECGKKSKSLPRQSLRDAVESLAVHAALRCELIPSVSDVKKVDPEIVKDFVVTGFSLSESKKTGEGVVLSGHKILSAICRWCHGI
jgi:hypothetical protein